MLKFISIFAAQTWSWCQEIIKMKNKQKLNGPRIHYITQNQFLFFILPLFIIIILFMTLVLCTLLICLATCKPYFSAKNQRIHDSEGGERIFHGLNFVFNGNQEYEKDFIYLKSQGINAIRTSLTWSDYELQQGQFNQTYLQQYVAWVNLAGKYNIYSLIEFHQDIFSPKFCGDGVPMWAIPKSVFQTFPIPVRKQSSGFDPKTGRPLHVCQEIQWGLFYTTLAVNEAFLHLWKNKNGLLDKFIIYWKKVVSAFKGNPYVIAFELVNEPWPGNMYANPAVMIPGLSERIHLQRAFNKLSQGMRKVDPDINICFEPVTWLNGFPTGFTSAPGGHRYSNSSFLCYHYYKPPSMNLDRFMGARIKDMKRLKVGGILSQFFILKQFSKQTQATMDKCDELSQSWFGWVYQPGNMVAGIKRTFSHRVAGSIIKQSFNADTREYELLYTSKKNAGETIIYFINECSACLDTISIHPKIPGSYRIVDEVYLHIDASKFEDGAPVMVIIAP